LTEVELWTIEQGAFLGMMEQYPALALTVTRMMANQLSRAQQFQQPRNTPPTPPRGPSGTPPRPTGGRPNVPPSPPNRVQQPPSGARPIKPATATPSKKAAVTGVVITGAAASVASSPAPTSAPKETVKPASPQQHSGLHMPHIQAPHFETPKLPHIETPHLPHIQAPHLQAPKLPHLQAPHISTPHLPQRHAAQSQPVVQQPAPRVRRASFFSEFGAWASHLSIGAKMRVLVGGLLVVWILFISFPIATVTTVSSAVAGLQISNSKGSDSGVQLIRNPSTGSGSNNKVAYAVATETPVPTKTPLPTKTPTPKPTSTPAPKAVPTKVPTAAPVAAAPVAPVAPPLPPRFIDPRLGDGPQVLPHLDKVKIAPANVAHGQKFWYVKSLKFEDITESSNDHTIYVKIYDESGKRTSAKIRAWGEGSGDYPADAIPEKSADDMCDCNYGVFMYGDGYSIQVVSEYPSDIVSGMIMPMRRHVNYKIQFQLVTNP
jgi:hypothetical protein